MKGIKKAIIVAVVLFAVTSALAAYVSFYGANYNYGTGPYITMPSMLLYSSNDSLLFTLFNPTRTNETINTVLLSGSSCALFIDPVIRVNAYSTFRCSTNFKVLNDTLYSYTVTVSNGFYLTGQITSQ